MLCRIGMVIFNVFQLSIFYCELNLIAICFASESGGELVLCETVHAIATFLLVHDLEVFFHKFFVPD